MRKRVLPSPAGRTSTNEKPGLHERSRHKARYDFGQLVSSCPELSAFVAPNAYGDLSIDFANAAAVRMLNQALLQHHYNIHDWNIPATYLCPPVPGRADYIHHLADLLAGDRGAMQKGPEIRALDIGTGASGIYPIIGHREYGWSFVGSDIDAKALKALEKILKANELQNAIELRLQSQPSKIFQGIVKSGERFDLTLCNPPFHASLAEAREGTDRKWRNLGKAPGEQRNFGGQGAELWCPGGEAAFIRQMIEESAEIQKQCLWFSTLVSKSSNLKAIQHELRQVRAEDVRIIDMAQGQKKSRFVAWTFMVQSERRCLLL